MSFVHGSLPREMILYHILPFLDFDASILFLKACHPVMLYKPIDKIYLRSWLQSRYTRERHQIRQRSLIKFRWFQKCISLRLYDKYQNIGLFYLQFSDLFDQWFSKDPTMDPISESESSDDTESSECNDIYDDEIYDNEIYDNEMYDNEIYDNEIYGDEIYDECTKDDSCLDLSSDDSDSDLSSEYSDSDDENNDENNRESLTDHQKCKLYHGPSSYREMSMIRDAVEEEIELEESSDARRLHTLYHKTRMLIV